MKTIIQKPVMDSLSAGFEKSALTSLCLYKAECHQHIDGKTQRYFGLTDQN